MYYTIYKISNKINGKIYIGSHKTKNLDDGYQRVGIEGENNPTQLKGLHISLDFHR